MSEGLKESVGLERDRKERKGKGQRGWSRRKDGNKREEEEEEEMRRGEREVEEEEEEIQKPHSHQQDGVTPGLLILS